jgi:hypothetical protein
MMLASSFNLSQSFNYGPFFGKKLFKSEINCFCIRTRAKTRKYHTRKISIQNIAILEILTPLSCSWVFSGLSLLAFLMETLNRFYQL